MQSVLNRINRFVRPEHNKRMLEKVETDKRYKLQLADEIEKWLMSPVGTFINDKIEADKKKCLLQMAKLDPENQIGLIQLQTKYDLLVSFGHYIGRIILEANNIKEL